MMWKTEDIGSWRSKLKIEKGGNESLSNERKEEIQVIFHNQFTFIFYRRPSYYIYVSVL